MQKQGQWIKIAESFAELTERGNIRITEREVNGRLVCIVAEEGKFFACAGKCPHAGAVFPRDSQMGMVISFARFIAINSGFQTVIMQAGKGFI